MAGPSASCAAGPRVQPAAPRQDYTANRRVHWRYQRQTRDRLHRHATFRALAFRRRQALRQAAPQTFRSHQSNRPGGGRTRFHHRAGIRARARVFGRGFGPAHRNGDQARFAADLEHSRNASGGSSRAWIVQPARPLPCLRSTSRRRVHPLRAWCRVNQDQATPSRALPRR